MPLYNVYARPIVTVKHENIEAESHEEAIGKLADYDYRQHFGERYAEDMDSYTVDVVGDSEYEQTMDFDGYGGRLPPISAGESRPLLTGRELATVLAALRHWQWRKRFEGNEEVPGWLPASPGSDLHFADFDPLSSREIDGLCERLNERDVMKSLRQRPS